MTEETPKIFKDRQETKVKNDKSRARILDTVFQQLSHRDKKRTITVINVRRWKRITKK